MGCISFESENTVMSQQNPQDELLAQLQRQAWDDGGIKSWENPDEAADLQKIALAATQLRVPATLSREEAWQRTLQRIEASESAGTKVRSMRFPMYARVLSVAASVAALIGAVVLFNSLNAEKPTTIMAASGERVPMYLPDSSFVTLNAGSSISFDKGSWDSDRKVELEGEAFFDVKSGSRFVVKTASGSVEVMGTEFNVRIRDGRMAVACYEGSVKVTATGKGFVVLKQGEVVETDASGAVAPRSEELPSQPEWISGRFVFDHEPFPAVVAELERQFKVRVEAKGMDQRTYSGSFYNDDLTTALQRLCEPMGLTIQELEPGHYRLAPK
jgi:transmembrane sensor